MPDPTRPHADPRLLPYVPRIAREWATMPDVRHRAVDATLVFADLTGFTGLTERLAVTGRRGAEEMATIIADTFDAMLAQAYRAGGSLLKFGGDALLLLFDRPDHERAGAWAAWEMRSTLRGRSGPTTSVGRVRLGMTSAVASGTVHCFMAGDEQRELIVGGEVVSTLMALERSATTGSTLVSDRTAAALPASTLARSGDGLARLARRPPPPPPTSTSEEATDGDLAPMVAPAVRHRLESGEESPEHRRVAVGFVSVEGVDDMIRADPASAASALHTLVGKVSDIARERGAWLLATDVSAGGAKLILVAGAPIATGHDEAALLSALSEVGRLETPLVLHMGAHHGPVFFGDIGPHYRRTLTVMGDTVNTAARLMAGATRGTVLASASMLESRHVGLRAGPARSMSLRGRVEPLEVVDVAGPVVAGARLATGHVVGREGQLARLEARADDVRAGRGGAIQLVGPPGSGRSRLLDEFLSRQAGVTILRTEASLHGRNQPYSVVRALFRDAIGLPATGRPVSDEFVELVDRMRTGLGTEASLLARALGLGESEDLDTGEIDPRYLPALARTALASLVDAWDRGPLVLAVDDAHHADAASWDMVRHLAGLASQRDWLVIATAPESIDWGGATVETVELGPLDRTALTTLALDLTEEQPLSTHELDELVRRSAGNPLLLREMLAARTRLGTLDSIPNAVESIVALHIDALHPDARRRLEVAAVLGTVLDPELYDWVAGEQVDWEEEGAGMVERTGDGRLRFVNPLTRDVIYDRLPFSRRASLHERVADRLGEVGAPPDQRAFHLVRAGRWSEAREAAVEAGKAAEAAFATVEAVHWYEMALTAARSIHDARTEIADLLERLGEARERAGEYGPAAEALREAERLAPAAATKARLLVRRARMLEKLGSYRHALMCLTRAQRLDPEAADVAAAASAHYAGIRFNQGRHRDALRLAARAAAIPDTAATRPHRALALMILDMARSAMGVTFEPDDSRESLRLFQRLGDLGGQARVANNLGMFAFLQGDWNEASRLYDESRTIFTTIGDEVNGSYGAANLAEIWAAQGRHEEAEALFREVRRVWRAADDRYGAAYIEGQLGLIAAARGRVEEAETRLRRAMAEFDAIGAKGEIEVVAAHLLESAVVAGRADLARETLATFDLVKAGDPGVRSRVARLQATLAWQEGRSEATELLRAAWEEVRAASDDLDELRLLELLARLRTDPDPARRRELGQRLGIIVSPVVPGPDRTVRRDPSSGNPARRGAGPDVDGYSDGSTDVRGRS